MNPQEAVTDWSGPNPDADQFTKAHRLSIGAYIAKHMGRCSGCSALVVEVELHNGSKRLTTVAQDDRNFMLDDRGNLCATPGQFVTAHSCNRAATAIAKARAEYEETMDMTTDEAWDEYSRTKLQHRQERWVAFGDCPDPIGGAREAGS